MQIRISNGLYFPQSQHKRQSRRPAALKPGWKQMSAIIMFFWMMIFQSGIKAGEDWEQALYEQLRVCRVFLPVLTQNWIDSKWCFAEMTHARSRGKLILPVKLDPALDTSSLFTDLQQTPIDLSGEDQSGYQRLQRALEEEFVWNDPQRSPYPGLLAFQEDEAAIYRGRDPEITNAIEILEGLRRRGRSAPHFVLFVGRIRQW